MPGRPSATPHAGASLPVVLAVVLGGALGGVLRWVLGISLPSECTGGCAGSPWAAPDLVVLGINVAGSFALALLPALLRRRHLDPRARAVWAGFLGPGLLGGFTTLSAVSLSTRALLADGDLLAAAGLPAVTLLLTVGAVAVAQVVGRSLDGRVPDGRVLDGPAADGRGPR